MKKLILLIVLFTISSCANRAVGNRVVELNNLLDPLLGQDEESVVLNVGAPARIDEVAGVKIYRYFQSYGQRSTASGNAYSNQYGTSAYGSGQSWESRDTINVYFKGGIMIKWDGYVQR